MEFTHLSGRRCLDFAGTFKWRLNPEPLELLTEPSRLSDWAHEAGLVDSAIAVTDADLADAIRLREATLRAVTARLDRRRPRPGDVDLLNDWTRRPRLTPRLLRSGAVRRDGTAPELLATLAADALDLLAGADIDRVKTCTMPTCTRLYVDTSRAQNRQWCGMGGCGNRAKVRAFRERQRAAR